MAAQSIRELTNNAHNELRYNSAKPLIVGVFMTDVCDMLNKCGVIIDNTSTYDISVEKAVREFQKKAGLSETGVLNNDTWDAMLLASKQMSDIVIPDETVTEEEQEDTSNSPHYQSFFDDDNSKTNRKNHKDIVIQFGNKSITKTIKDVFMRSVTVEVDTSGNPIFEIYEFIARDIKESDEASDASRYTSDQDSSASSDIQYNFNFVKPTTPEKRATPDEGVGGGGGGGSVNSW